LLLSSRELQILQLLTDGKTRAEASRELCLALETVKGNMRAAMRRLGALNQSHAVAIAWRAGVIT
jgi:DNA-binding CsgD family transcriptional regulator